MSNIYLKRAKRIRGILALTYKKYFTFQPEFVSDLASKNLEYNGKISIKEVDKVIQIILDLK